MSEGAEPPNESERKWGRASSENAGRHMCRPTLFCTTCASGLHQRGSFRRPPLKSPSSKLTAAATAAAAIPATATAATTATEAAFRFRTCFVDDQRAPVHLLLVEFGDGFLRFLVRAHLDESEAARAAGRHVAHHANAVHLAGAAEQFGELIFGCGVRKVPDVESPAHAVTYSCPRQPVRHMPQRDVAACRHAWLRYKMTRDCSDSRAARASWTTPVESSRGLLRTADVELRRQGAGSHCAGV